MKQARRAGSQNSVSKIPAELFKDQIFSVIESMDDAFFVVDRSWRFVYVNKTAEQLVGNTRNILLSKKITTFFPDFKKTEFFRQYNTALSSGKSSKLVQQSKQTNRWYEVNVYPMEELLHIHLRDITEKKREEIGQKFLAEAGTILSSSLDYEKTLSKVAELAVPVIADWCVLEILENDELKLVAVAHVDPKKVALAYKLRKQYPPDPNAKTGSQAVIRSGKAEIVNNLTEDVYKQSVGDKRLLGLIKKLNIRNYMVVPIKIMNRVLGTVTLVSSTEDRAFQERDQQIASRFADKAALAVENSRLYRATQKELEWRERAQLQLIELQDRLKYSREQLETILETSADGITVQDQTGQLVYANDSAAVATGFSSAESMRKATLDDITDRFEIIDESCEPLSFDLLPGRRALRGEIAPEEVVGYRIKKTGEVRWSSVRATPLLDDAGNVQYAVNIFHDITERKNQERRKDDFISIASHELKTPLTTLKILSQGLRDILVRHSQKKEHQILDRMESQLDRLSELIRDLLDVSKINAGTLTVHPRRFNAVESIKRLSKDYQEMTTDHTFVLNLPRSVTFEADQTRFEQVVGNFISNAIKYSPQGGTITIKLSRTKNSVLFSVNDQGRGITHANIKRVFERFFREHDDSKAGGLGMGLYICSKIVELHSGKIWVESQPNVGSTFFAEFPLRQSTDTKK